jgi:hypothetical protein
LSRRDQRSQGQDATKAFVQGLKSAAREGTSAIKSLAANLEATFRRIQSTPDLLPSDVTGTEVYYEADGRGTFQFQPGPPAPPGAADHG